MLGKCSTTEPHRQQREDKGKNVEDQHKMFWDNNPCPQVWNCY
jgi:hypothetical protein